MNVAATLRRAAEEIKVRGWCKRTAVDASGRVCAIGAVWFAAGGDVNNWPQSFYSIQNYIHEDIRKNEAAIYLGQYLRIKRYGTPEVDTRLVTSQIWWWNDDATSAEEILDGLEGAAKQWEQENA